MPRLTPITKREQVSEDALTAFDAIIESRGNINGPHSMVMYAPEVARSSTALSDSLRFGGNLSDHDTELAIITAARHWDCEYVWASHSAAALRAGARQAIGRLSRGVDPEEAGLTDEGSNGNGSLIDRHVGR